MSTNKETIALLIKALEDLVAAYRLIPRGTEHHAYKQAHRALKAARAGA